MRLEPQSSLGWNVGGRTYLSYMQRPGVNASIRIYMKDWEWKLWYLSIHIRPRITSLFIHSLRAEPVHLSSVSQYNQCLVLVVKLVLWVIPVGWLCWCRGWCGLLKLPLTTGTLNAAAALPANSGTLWSDTGAWTSRQRRRVSSAPHFHHTKQRCCLHSNSILSILTCYLLLSPHSASAHDRCGIVSRFEIRGGRGGNSAN